MGKKILITGVAGFIGSHIAEKLLKKGYAVDGLDDLNDYYSPKIKEFNLSFLQKYDLFKFKHLDILSQKEIYEIIEKGKYDYLVHCAARAGVRASVADPLIYSKTNIIGTQILLEGLRLYSPDTKSILLSSSSVYGIQKKSPFSEEMMPNPTSPYGASKYSMELMAKQYSSFFDLSLVIVRPFSIYGPRGRVDMAPFLMVNSAENGRPFIKYGTNEDNKRDWTYIDDFVDGILKIINHGFRGYELVNLGNNDPIGIDDFVDHSRKMIREYLKKDLSVIEKPRSKEELPITFADINKAKKLFGYAPQTDFEKGFELFIKYYLDNKDKYHHRMQREEANV
jgi:nucleoside-diphosphate-sugar epimerase